MRDFLLTFTIKGAGDSFEWFDTEEELLDRVEQLGDNVIDIDAIELRVVRTIIES